MVWVSFPLTRHILVFRGVGPVSRLGPGDELQGEDVLPGFSVLVENLFLAVEAEQGS